MVAIGGWNAGVYRFQQMTRSSQSRARFINSLLEFMQRRNLDGFDLDWEYPSVADKSHLSYLMHVSRWLYGLFTYKIYLQLDSH